MPKSAIRLALSSITKGITSTWGYDHVCVPKQDTKKCSWTSRQKFGVTLILFQVMNDVIDFVLDNTFISDLEGGTWRQIRGIPMGDPHSPGMAIGTCAWMEKEWCHGLHDTTKTNSKRYAIWMTSLCSTRSRITLIIKVSLAILLAQNVIGSL